MLLQAITQPYNVTAVQVVWALGLVLALLVTLVDVALVIRVIRAARKIDALASRTLTAAGGIATHTAAISQLGATLQVGAALIEKAGPIVTVAASIEQKLMAVSRFFARR